MDETEITRMLAGLESGEARAEDLLPPVYDELRALAHEQPGQTLQATALVHEAWMRVTEGQAPDWNGRGHFFAAAVQAMRRILVERARRKARLKHGGAARRARRPRTRGRGPGWFGMFG